MCRAGIPRHTPHGYSRMTRVEGSPFCIVAIRSATRHHDLLPLFSRRSRIISAPAHFSLPVVFLVVNTSTACTCCAQFELTGYDLEVLGTYRFTLTHTYTRTQMHHDRKGLQNKLLRKAKGWEGECLAVAQAWLPYPHSTNSHRF
jgi:hypothetical protein